MASDMYFVQAEYVYNQALNYKRIVKYAGEPLSHPESVASSAVINFCLHYYSLCPYEFANNSILGRLFYFAIFLFWIISPLLSLILDHTSSLKFSPFKSYSNMQ